MLILGEKETKSKNVSVRKHRIGDLGTMSVKSFVGLLNNEISDGFSKFEN